MHLIDCDFSHAPAILGIFNDAIANSVALYEYQPRTMETMRAWFDAKQKGTFPIRGLVTDAGELAGFASYGPFRPQPGYKYTVEHSVYVATAFRRQGVGARLLEDLITCARQQQFHAMVGVIDADNAASIALHERFGFKPVGRLPQAGFKFGRWLDACFYQLLLDTPASPVDG